MYKDFLIFKGNMRALSFQNDHSVDMCFVSVPPIAPTPLSDEDLVVLYADPSHQIFEKINLRHENNSCDITSLIDPRSVRIQTPKSALSSVHIDVNCHMKSLTQERLSIQKELQHIIIDWDHWNPPEGAPYRLHKGDVIFDTVVNHNDKASLVLNNPNVKRGRVKKLIFDIVVDHIVMGDFFQTDEGRHALNTAVRRGLCHLNASFRCHRIYVSIPWENAYNFQLHHTVTLDISNFKKMTGQIVELTLSYTDSSRMCHIVIACFDGEGPLIIKNNPDLTLESTPVQIGRSMSIDRIHCGDDVCEIHIKRRKILRERTWVGHVETTIDLS
jgi:hypothetical protein